jgi:hypothetical protein
MSNTKMTFYFYHQIIDIHSHAFIDESNFIFRRIKHRNFTESTNYLFFTDSESDSLNRKLTQNRI